jgi:hypothetical protein
VGAALPATAAGAGEFGVEGTGRGREFGEGGEAKSSSNPTSPREGGTSEVHARNSLSRLRLILLKKILVD